MQIGGVYTIDFAKVSKIPKFNVNVKTGDSKRTIKLILLKNNEVLNLKNYTIVVSAKKSDKNDIFNNVKKVDEEKGICEIEITNQMLVVDMNLPCEIILYGLNGEVASSSDFIINAIHSTRNEESIESSSEFSALSEAMKKVTDIDRKMNRGESISVSQIDKNRGKLDQTYMTEEFLQQMVGNTPINTVPADRSITRIKIAEKAITENEVNTDFLERAHALDKNKKIKASALFDTEIENLFNKNTLTKSSYIINGVVKPSSSTASYSDYISVKPSSLIWCTHVLDTDGGAFYDRNFNFLSKITRRSSENENVISIPENCYYIRLNVPLGKVKEDDFVVVTGEVAPNTYKEHFFGKINGLMLDSNNIDGLVCPEVLDSVEFYNLYDDSTSEKNKFISNLGIVKESDSIDLSRYIRVTPGETLGCNFKYVEQGAYFNISKKFIKKMELAETADGWFTETVPEGAYFVRVNVTHYRLSAYMLKKSNVKPKFYSPYSANLKYLNTNVLKNKKVLCIGDSITWLDGNTASGYNGGKTVVVGYQEQFRSLGAIVTSCGHSGATIRKYHESDDMEHGSLVDDIKNSNYNVANFDIITIFAGTNDVGRGLRLGTLGNESDNSFDETTTIGALRSMIEYIRSNNPTCEIYLITPIRSSLSSRPYEKMEQVADAIISVAKMYSIPYIDLLHEGGIGKLNVDIFTYDKLHPNNEGFERIGKRMARIINSK